jgi:DnaJ-class molecular chaperone
MIEFNLNELLSCPFCYGGVVFHKTYGTEKKCSDCLGKGKIKRKKLVKLDLS